MCTLLIASHVHPVAPLVLAANRDEFYARPATGPEVLHLARPRIVGGRDLEAGGTWMGLGDHGLVVGLTNLHSRALGRRSRGALVLDALSCQSPEDIDELLRTQAAACEFRPFNLVYGTANDLRIAQVTDDGVHMDAIAPGLHVIPSGGAMDDTRIPRVRRGLALLERATLKTEEGALVEALHTALADHALPTPAAMTTLPDPPDLPPEVLRTLQAMCVHTPLYGTRSSAVILVGGSENRYYYGDGPACQSRLARVDHLLALH